MFRLDQVNDQHLHLIPIQKERKTKESEEISKNLDNRAHTITIYKTRT